MSGGSSQNVTLQQAGGGVTNNRIANVNGGASYAYDATGNTTFDAIHGFSYDAESRIVKVDGGSTGTYSYDAANRRVKKFAQGHTTYYVWEGSKVIAEYGDAPGGSGGTRFYHPDRLSNRMITDGNGAVKGTMDNLPFGEDGGAIGESEKHRFTSYERDSEAGSDYAINRELLYVTGRFSRSDPVGGSIADPQSINRYPYARNDPVNFSDPLGLVVYYCPPQFSSCATLTVSINGVVFDVNVGFSRGHGTFLWNQLGVFDQASIARLLKDSPPPEGFDIFPSFKRILNDGSIEKAAGTQIFKKFVAELRKCDDLRAETFAKYLQSRNVDLSHAKRAVGVLRGIDALLDLGELAAGPPWTALAALSLFGVIPSWSDAFDSEDFLDYNETQVITQAVAAGKNARKLCRKQVRRKYGISREVS